MRFPSLLLATALLLPSLSHAKEFTCSSAKPADPVGGWITLPTNSNSGSIELELRNGALPYVLVSAPFASASKTTDALVYGSEADSHNGSVATLTIPLDSVSKDAFAGEVRILGPGKPLAYSLNCRSGG